MSTTGLIYVATVLHPPENRYNGDGTLKVVARTIKDCLRSGVDELVVFLPETDGDRIRQALAAMSIQIEQATLQVTISVGVATMTAQDQDLIASKTPRTQPSGD